MTCAIDSCLTWRRSTGPARVLAVVFVGLDDSIEGPFYLANPFQREPDWGVAVANYDLGRSLQQVRAADKNQ